MQSEAVAYETPERRSGPSGRPWVRANGFVECSAALVLCDGLSLARTAGVNQSIFTTADERMLIITHSPVAAAPVRNCNFFRNKD